MKQLLLLIALAAAPASAAERRFTVTDFDRIQVDGPFEVVLKTGRPSGAVARGAVHDLDRVSIQVVGRLLKIRTGLEGWKPYPGDSSGPVTIELSTHGLTSAFVRGSGSLSIDAAKAMRFDLSVFGTGKIAIDRLEADTANLVLVGSGRAILGGAVKTFHASIEGAGDLDAAKLKTLDAVINGGTSGNIALTAAHTAKLQTSGSGDVTIAGDPACTVTTRGSGRVICGAGR